MKILNQIPPQLNKGDLVALDVETFGQTKGKIHRPTGTFACLSICSDDKIVYQIYDQKQIPAALKAIDKATWVFHNCLYDLTQLRRFAKIQPRYIHDTMLMDQATNGGMFKTFSLGDLSRRHLNEYMEKDVRTNFETATEMTREMKQYNAKDALKTLKIAKIQVEKYSSEPGLRAYVNEDEPCIFPVLDMAGFPVDKVGWVELIREFQETANRLESELELNVMSAAQVKAYARKNGLMLKDTRAQTLESFKQHPFISKVLEARKYRKAVSTYGIKWLENVDTDGKVYSSYHITGAETGRMSASNPNMQQIPARRLPQYRSLFKAHPGHTIVVSDVNQQEPRILAFESGDSELLGALKAGISTHLAVARTIFKDDKLTKADQEKYYIGKIVNLGVAYGMSKYKLAESLGISEATAEEFLRQYFTRFREVMSWISRKRNDARRMGYVQTAAGRKIFLNPYNHSFENNAINAPIQGGAADFTKVWLRGIWDGCRKAKITFPVCGLIHDELVAHVPNAEVKTYVKIMNEAFQATAAKLYKGIPFEVETEKGKSWGVKQDSSEAIGDDNEE